MGQRSTSASATTLKHTHPFTSLRSSLGTTNLLLLSLGTIVLLYWLIFVYHATPVIGAGPAAATSGNVKVLHLKDVPNSAAWRASHHLPSLASPHTTTQPSVSLFEIHRHAGAGVTCRCANPLAVDELKHVNAPGISDADRLAEATCYELDIDALRHSSGLSPARAIPLPPSVRDGDASPMEMLEDTVQEYNAALYRAQGKTDPQQGSYHTRRRPKGVSRNVRASEQHNPPPRDSSPAGAGVDHLPPEVAPSPAEIEKELGELAKHERIISMLEMEETIDLDDKAQQELVAAAEEQGESELRRRPSRSLDQMVEEFKVMFAADIAEAAAASSIQR
jgi:hypothetical protein